MKHFMVKAAGVALSAVMMLGAGSQVMAAQTGDADYTSNITVEAHRASRYSTWSYSPAEDMVSVNDSGRYSVSINCDRSFPKTITIADQAGNVISEYSTTDSSFSYDVDLYSGENFTITVTAENFVTNSQAHDGSAVINVSMALDEAYPDVLPSGLVSDHCDESMFVGGAIGNPNLEPVFPQGMLDDHCDESMFIGGSIPLVIVDEAIPADEVVTASIDEVTTSGVSDIAVNFLTPDQIKTMSVRNFVGHMYLECLGRTATDEEMANYIDMLQNRGVTASTIAASMLTSKEFEDKNVSNEEFVAILTNVFGDGISSDVALAALESGSSRSAVIHQFAGTQQWASRCAFYQVNV